MTTRTPLHGAEARHVGEQIRAEQTARAELNHLCTAAGLVVWNADLPSHCPITFAVMPGGLRVLLADRRTSQIECLAYVRAVLAD